jgi:enoyl-CoA hydratase
VELVETSVEDGVAVVALNDPPRRNAITAAMADQLEAQLAELEANADVKALVVTGSGAAFCAGADREALRGADEAKLRTIYGAFLAVRDFPLPTVAAVNGPAIGAGFNLALACDVRIAARSALFDSRFITIPIHPGGGHAWMLERATTSQVTAAMTLFSDPVDGQRAFDIGLAWRCVPDAALLSDSLEFCAKATSAPRSLLREVKATIRNSPSLPTHADAMSYELSRQVASVQTPVYADRFKVGR